MTKIMSWNIEEFDQDRIGTGASSRYSPWLGQLNTFSTTSPTPSPLQFLEYATSNFPIPTEKNQAFVWLYRYILIGALNGDAGSFNGAIADEASSTSIGTFIASYSTYLLNYSTDPTLPKLDVKQSALPNSITAAIAPLTASGTYLNVLNTVYQTFLSSSSDTYGYQTTLMQISNMLNGGQSFSTILTTIGGTIATCQTLVQHVLNHILENIAPGGVTNNLPDILVLVEVMSGTPVTRYNVIDGAGANGLMNLLTVLRTIEPKYCLIPPVRLGDGNMMEKEGIAIFYNSAKLQFQGPNIWNGVQAFNPSTPVTTDTASDNYGPVFCPLTTASLPPGVGGYALPNVGLATPIVFGTSSATNENQLAGRTIFIPSGATATSPLTFMTPTDRPPLLTQFQEYLTTDSPGSPTGRIIKLCSMHCNRGSGGGFNAPQAVAELAKIQEMMPTTTTTGTEVRVIIGDLNVELLDGTLLPPGGKTAKDTAYQPLTSLGYTLVFDDARLSTTSPINNSYATTVLKALEESDTNNNFPGFGYFKTFGKGSNKYFESLDNVLVAGTGVTITNAIILNRVIGVGVANQATFGYGASSIPPTNLSSPYRCDMINTIDDIQKKSFSPILTNMTTSKAIVASSKVNFFREIQNYGKIRTASDHMALVIEI